MSFNKTLKSEAAVVIVGGGQKDLFPIGFEYMAHGHVYKVTDRFFNDNTEWRRIRDDSGTIEDVTVATILEDLNTGRPITKSGIMKAYKPERDAEARVIKDPGYEARKAKAAQQAEEEAAEAADEEERLAPPVVKPRLIKKIKSKSAKVVKASTKKPKRR